MESRTAVRRDLIRQIVILDERRILSRLRSKQAARTSKTLGRPDLLALLSKTINDPFIGQGTKAELLKARSQSERLSRTFESFETAYHTSHLVGAPLDILVDVVIQAHEFDTRNLKELLQSWPSKDLTLKSFLPEAVGKLGRYYSIACDLVDAARQSNYTMFQRIFVETLNKPMLNKSHAADNSAGFEDVLQRVASSSSQQCDWKYPLDALSAARTYRERISDCTTHWKVHAEIQLLLYHEQNPDIPHPRIISSSKSACYLCDLFIKVHGKFCVPRTHGKLYGKWTLPEWLGHQSSARQRIQDTVERFNVQLEFNILETMRERKPHFHYPNESVLGFRESWSSTSTLCQPRTRHAGARPPASAPRDGWSKSDESSSRRPIQNNPGSPSKRTAATSLTAIQEMQKPRNKVDEFELTREGMDTPGLPAASEILLGGDTKSHKLSHQSDTLIVRTDQIELHASWDGDMPTTKDSCWIQVTSLAAGLQVLDGDNSEVVDLDELDSTQDKTIEGGSALGSRALCMRKGGQMLLLQYSFEDEPME